MLPLKNLRNLVCFGIYLLCGRGDAWGRFLYDDNTTVRFARFFGQAPPRKF